MSFKFIVTVQVNRREKKSTVYSKIRLYYIWEYSNTSDENIYKIITFITNIKYDYSKKILFMTSRSSYGLRKKRHDANVECAASSYPGS